MKNATFFLTQPQYDWLAARLPEPPSKTRRAIPNDELLNGVLFVLKTGCRWQDIPDSICRHGYSSCWRRLNYWQACDGLKTIWQGILLLLDRQGVLDLSLGHIDGSLVQSPAFGDGTGYSGKHHRVGTNISLVTDKQGVPLANGLTAGNRHDLVSAEATIRKVKVGRRRRLSQLNADKGYDSRSFRTTLRKRGIKANIPERSFKHRRKRGRKPVLDAAAFKFRSFIERTNAWVKYFRRLRYRWERRMDIFQAFVDLGCLLICLRKMEI
jgi:transposase